MSKPIGLLHSDGPAPFVQPVWGVCGSKHKHSRTGKVLRPDWEYWYNAQRTLDDTIERDGPGVSEHGMYNRLTTIPLTWFILWAWQHGALVIDEGRDEDGHTELVPCDGEEYTPDHGTAHEWTKVQCDAPRVLEKNGRYGCMKHSRVWRTALEARDLADKAYTIVVYPSALPERLKVLWWDKVSPYFLHTYEELYGDN